MAFLRIILIIGDPNCQNAPRIFWLFADFSLKAQRPLCNKFSFTAYNTAQSNFAKV